jgi:hypothetical protein
VVSGEAQAISLPVFGLVSDPGPFTAAPEGALIEAQNVVVLRPGVIEPRPGTQWFKDPVLKAGGDDVASIYADANSNIFTWSSFPWLIRKNGGTTITGPSSFVPGKIRTCSTGGRALFTSESGVCTLPEQLASPANGSATVAYRAGLPQPFVPQLALDAAPSGSPAGANWLANGAVAYRFTLRRRLANGTIVESAPTQRVVVRNAAAGQAVRIGRNGLTAFDFYFAWAPNALGTIGGFNELIEGDQLCVYRSSMATPSTAEPGDELRLRAVVEIDATTKAFTVGGQNWLDALPDSEWNGPPLYANETDEGIAFANYRPSYARDIALYNGMTFYAGAKSAQRVDLRLTRMGDAVDWSQTLTNRAFVANLTITNNIITGISDADVRELSVGQVVTFSGTPPGDPDGFFAANTQILNITYSPGNNSVNLSNPALTTNASTALIAWDWVETDDGTTTHRVYAETNTSAITTAAIFEARWAENPGVQLRITAALHAETYVQDLVFSFEQPDPGDGPFVVRSSKPLAWDRYVDSATGVTSATLGGDAELTWSKTGEPEHCPLPFRTVIGDAAHPIRRIIAARQSLLVFKDDGLFLVYGQVPTEITPDLLDRTIVLPAPKDSGGDEPSKWVGILDDRVFAMTTRGPLAITDAGSMPVGAPILESLRRRFTSSYGANDESLRALMVDTQSRRVGFFFDENGDGTRSVGYVLDVDAGTWVYWVLPRPLADFASFPAIGASMFGGGYAYGFFYDSRTALAESSITPVTMPPTYEAWPAEAIDILTVTGTGPYEITIDALSEYSPVVGDVIVAGGVAHEVTSVTSSTVFESDTQPAVGSATWREGIDYRVVWAGRAEGNPTGEKLWGSITFPFELGLLLSRMKYYVRGYRNQDAAQEGFFDASQAIGVSPWSLVPTIKRFIPRSHASDWAIRVGFTLRQAGAWFSTAGLGLLFNRADGDNAGGRRR